MPSLNINIVFGIVPYAIDRLLAGIQPEVIIITGIDDVKAHRFLSSAIKMVLRYAFVLQAHVGFLPPCANTPSSIRFERGPRLCRE